MNNKLDLIVEDRTGPITESVRVYLQISNSTHGAIVELDVSKIATVDDLIDRLEGAKDSVLIASLAAHNFGGRDSEGTA